MSRARERLSAAAVRHATKPGFYHDGGGLYLQVSQFGTKSWILRYTIDKKTRDMGLGPVADWSLAEARERAKKFRQLVDDKIDPIEFRRKEQEARATARENLKTFEECAIACHGKLKPTWKNPKHGDQWINTLTTYAFPVIGKLNVASVGKKSVADVLTPIWLLKQETASRVLQRIRAVLTYASAHDYYPGYDLKMWDELPQLLPQRPERKQAHHASCPYLEAAELIKKLQGSTLSELLKLAFEFTVLTGVRSSEARGALKAEIDLKQKVWNIPEDRMKMGIAHVVPLSDR
ncbi:MAG: integrase arm-type DNA-binding domain-containing protein, partial [Pseudomonadota bacterium]